MLHIFAGSEWYWRGGPLRIRNWLFKAIVASGIALALLILGQLVNILFGVLVLVMDGVLAGLGTIVIGMIGIGFLAFVLIPNWLSAPR